MKVGGFSGLSRRAAAAVTVPPPTRDCAPCSVRIYYYYNLRGDVTPVVDETKKTKNQHVRPDGRRNGGKNFIIFRTMQNRGRIPSVGLSDASRGLVTGT